MLDPLAISESIGEVPHWNAHTGFWQRALSDDHRANTSKSPPTQANRERLIDQAVRNVGEPLCWWTSLKSWAHSFLESPYVNDVNMREIINEYNRLSQSLPNHP